MYVAPGEGAARAAWIAGRRVGGAVQRNRARRLLREAWWRLWTSTTPGHLVVLVAEPAIAGAKADEVTEEIRKLLMRAGVVRP